MNIHTIGIDLGKTVFHLVGLNLRGEVVVRKKLSRSQLLRFAANLQVHLIGMEACGGSHFLGKALQEQGPEAVGRPSMRFVPINESCRRLDEIPGIGPVTATALIAAIGNGAAFRKGREFAAWVGD